MTLSTIKIPVILIDFNRSIYINSLLIRYINNHEVLNKQGNTNVNTFQLFFPEFNLLQLLIQMEMNQLQTVGT
jgi:hypothetical protein